jgi:hypothetical protein
MVISSELTNRKKIFDDVRSKKDIVEAKRTRKGGVTDANHRESGTIANNNGRGKGGGR